jgi:tryptophan synthase alpha chain
MLEGFKKQKKPAFIPFIVAGFPSLSATDQMIDVLVEEGADLLELGVPFSDALADGPVIQEASEKASKILPSIDQVIEFAAKVRKRHPSLPIILFTYFNPIFKMGVETFAEQAKRAGVTAALVVDLPPEEATHYQEHMKKNGVKTVFLASPTTSPERIPLIGEASTGFMYYVSRTGVTGVQSEVSQSLESELTRVRNLTSRPIAVGFGISNGAQAKTVARLSDAVVVGSAFVRLMAKNAQDPDSMEREVRALAREISSSIND